MSNMKGCKEYSITFPSTEFELVMRRKQNVKDEIAESKNNCFGCVYEMVDAAKNDYYKKK